MKVERTATVLTIKETPGCMWVFGAFFAVVGLMFVYGASGGYSNFDEITPFVMTLHLLLGSAAVAAGIWVIFISPKTMVVIDRNAERITLRRTGLGNRTDRTFAFEKIREFSLHEESDSEGDAAWFLQFATTGGEEFRVTSVSSPVRSTKQDVAFEINQFMYKQVPSYKESVMLEDENRRQIE